ncbi:MAG TPA: hypothetical protein VMC41_02520 [Candidatus Nanoarchaeia archaeon]|nr:hypothetical protein [Candidatus Nanoarchaeia archaeon]
MKKLVGLLVISVFCAAYSAPCSWALVPAKIQPGLANEAVYFDLIVKDLGSRDSVCFLILVENGHNPPSYIPGSGRGGMSQGEFFIKQESFQLAVTGAGDEDFYVVKYDQEKMGKKILLFSNYHKRKCFFDSSSRPPAVNCQDLGDNALFFLATSPFSDQYPPSYICGLETSYQLDSAKLHKIVVTKANLVANHSYSFDDSYHYDYVELERISIDTSASVARTEQYLRADSLIVNFFLASGAEITRSYFIGNSVTSVNPARRFSSFVNGADVPSAYYNVLGRKIVNAKREAVGFNLIRLPSGTMMKNMNLDRLR